jgi:hypothetical protein
MRFIDCCVLMLLVEEKKLGLNSLIGRFEQARRKKQTRKGFAQDGWNFDFFEIGHSNPLA